MRRLASVLVASSRRTDKSDAPTATDDAGRSRPSQKKPRIFHSLSRKHPLIDSPSLPPLVASELVNSSSSSSSGSTTLRTPDDDGLPRTPSKKGSWKAWLGGRNTPVNDHPEGRHSPTWQSPRNVRLPSKSVSNETDDVSFQSDVPDAIHSPTRSRQQIAAARANAQNLIMNSLVNEPTAPPLFQSSGAISFPRSCHTSRRLRRRETFESGLHKKSLLARLDNLSSSEESSIATLSSKAILLRPQSHPSFQDDIFPSADSVNLHSSGLGNWVSRPYFEDRLQLWTCSDSGEIIRTRIPGSHLGVAALEYSETLELLAGTLMENDDDVQAEIAFDPALEFTLPPLALNPDPLATRLKEMVLEPLSRPSDLPRSHDSLARPSPSPQFNNPSPAVSETPPPVQESNGTMTSGSAVMNDPVPKRGVRFADDDGKDDQIPLGYVLRIRKNKEQKAQFLREERERRERATQLSMEHRRTAPRESRVSRVSVHRQLPSHPLISLNEVSKPQQRVTVSHVVREEERLRREAERIEMEKLRRSRELARKQAEERERSYVEELQATRARREASRAGRPLESAILVAGVPDRDRPGSRDSMQASLRRSNNAYKPTPELVFSPVSTHEGSPSSSVPATPGSQYSFSRPPSLYSAHTTSSEDVRGREGKRASRRMSVVSDSPKGMLLHPPYDPRGSFNPYGWNVPPVPPIPTIPTVNGVPFYGGEMPLLPPTAPFMVNQFSARPRSYTGSAGGRSPLQSSTSLPRNYSSEGVTSSRNSSPHSFGTHQRRSSDDSARVTRALGDSRTGVYGGKTSGSIPITPSQKSPRRSSWLPAEQNLKKPSSLRPVSSMYSPGAPAQLHRRTDAS